MKKRIYSGSCNWRRLATFLIILTSVVIVIIALSVFFAQSVGNKNVTQDQSEETWRKMHIVDKQENTQLNIKVTNRPSQKIRPLLVDKDEHLRTESLELMETIISSTSKTNNIIRSRTKSIIPKFGKESTHIIQSVSRKEDTPSFTTRKRTTTVAMTTAKYISHMPETIYSGITNFMYTPQSTEKVSSTFTKVKNTGIIESANPGHDSTSSIQTPTFGNVEGEEKNVQVPSPTKHSTTPSKSPKISPEETKSAESLLAPITAEPTLSNVSTSVPLTEATSQETKVTTSIGQETSSAFIGTIETSTTSISDSTKSPSESFTSPKASTSVVTSTSLVEPTVSHVSTSVPLTEATSQETKVTTSIGQETSSAFIGTIETSTTLISDSTKSPSESLTSPKASTSVVTSTSLVEPTVSHVSTSVPLTEATSQETKVTTSIGQETSSAFIGTIETSTTSISDSTKSPSESLTSPKASTSVVTSTSSVEPTVSHVSTSVPLTEATSQETKVTTSIGQETSSAETTLSTQTSAVTISNSSTHLSSATPTATSLKVETISDAITTELSTNSQFTSHSTIPSNVTLSTTVNPLPSLPSTITPISTVSTLSHSPTTISTSLTTMSGTQPSATTNTKTSSYLPTYSSIASSSKAITSVEIIGTTITGSHSTTSIIRPSNTTLTLTTTSTTPQCTDKDCQCVGGSCVFNATLGKCHCLCHEFVFGDVCSFGVDDTSAHVDTGRIQTRKANITLEIQMTFQPAFNDLSSPQSLQVINALELQLAALCKEADPQTFKKVQVINLWRGSVVSESVAEYTYPNSEPHIQFLNTLLEAVLIKILNNTNNLKKISQAFNNSSVKLNLLSLQPPVITNIQQLKPYIDCSQFANYTAVISNGQWKCAGPCKTNPVYCHQHGQCLNDISEGPICRCSESSLKQFYGPQCDLFHWGPGFYAALFGSLAAALLLLIIIITAVIVKKKYLNVWKRRNSYNRRLSAFDEAFFDFSSTGDSSLGIAGSYTSGGSRPHLENNT